ncbi:MAG: serine/threonine protein kinase [Candidatus Obscuribacter sp.]|nr:serine/threonine protein kinase [Candidatus Obscuribacter sp.]
MASKADICRNCKKPIPLKQRSGSITDFFFKDQRCNCRRPEDGTPDFSHLATRFHGKNIQERRRLFQTDKQTRRARSAGEQASLFSLAPGKIVGGCYQLIELAGQGGMGSVFSARHTGLGRQCAIKFLAPDIVSEQTWKLFQAEAKIIAALRHRTICQIYDLGIAREGGYALPFYTMDYIAGETLEEAITRQGPLSVGATLELFLQVCDGLSYAHRQGVVHKDLKPANLMLYEEDGEPEVKILDFGIAELTDRANFAVSDHAAPSGGKPKRKIALGDDVIGSAAYMSPEQFSAIDIDRRSDIYNLGCTMFETLTGTPPFTGASFDELASEHRKTPPPTLKERTGQFFPPQIEAILAKCLEKSPQRRYQNTNELAIDLRRTLEGKELQFAKLDAISLPNQENGQKQQERSGWLLIAAALTLTIVSAWILVKGLDYFLSKDQKMTESKGADTTTGKTQPEGSSAESSKEETPESPITQHFQTMDEIGLREDDISSMEKGLIDYFLFADDSVRYSLSSAIEKTAHFALVNTYTLKLRTDVPVLKGVIRTIPHERLIYRPLAGDDIKTFLASFGARPCFGLDFTAVSKNLPDCLSYAAKKTPNIRYLYLPVDSSSNTEKLFEVLSDFKKLRSLTFSGSQTPHIVLHAPTNLSLIVLDGFINPKFILHKPASQNSTAPPPRREELSRLVSASNSPYCIHYKNCDLNEVSLKSDDGKGLEPTFLIFEDCKMKEFPKYGAAEIIVISEQDSLAPWEQPKELLKGFKSLYARITLVKTKWSEAKCQQFSQSVNALDPQLRFTTTNKFVPPDYP